MIRTNPRDDDPPHAPVIYRLTGAHARKSRPRPGAARSLSLEVRPAVFLDRDDTLVRCNDLPPPPPPGARGDLVDPALVELLPHAAEGCAMLKRAGFSLVVVSNQGCVARGAATLDRVHEVNIRVQALLSAGAGAMIPDRPVELTRSRARAGDARTISMPPGIIDAFYFCPYHPRGTVPEFTREHPWRKPAPGMIRAAVADLDLDLSRSWLVGDAARDVEAGVAAGLSPERCLRVGHDHPARDVLDAARMILGR